MIGAECYDALAELEAVDIVALWKLCNDTTAFLAEDFWVRGFVEAGPEIAE